MSVRERHVATYFITFIVDYTHYDHIFLITHKPEARYLSLVENQKNETVKALRTNRGEYLSEMFKQLCNKKGIKRQLTISYTP